MKVSTLLLSTSMILTSTSIIFAADDSKQYVLGAASSTAAATFPTFQEIMADFGDKKPTFEDCCKLYNPKIMLNDIYLEFQKLKESRISGAKLNEPLKNLFLKFVFAHRFHFMLSGKKLETPIECDLLAEFDAMKSRDAKSLKPKDNKSLYSLVTSEKWDPKNNDLKLILRLFGIESEQLSIIETRISAIVSHIFKLVSPKTPVKKPFESVVSKNPGLLINAASLGVEEALEYLFTEGNKRFITQDIHRAEFYFKQAAMGGDIHAMFNLSIVLEKRDNSEALQEAEKYYRKAATLGNPEAMNNLGSLLDKRGELKEAEQWYRKAATLGSPVVMFNFGLLLSNRGELKEAEKWYRKAAALGHPGAMFNLSTLLGERDNSEALQEAEQWYRKAATLGNLNAMNNLGLLLSKRGESKEAEKWYRKVATLGRPEAMNNLGLLLDDRGESKEAEQWYRKAATLGNLNAMNNLGLLFSKRGESKEAEKWFRKAATLGDTEAMNYLGLLSLVRGESEEAEIWLRKAVGLGNPRAMYILGLLLHERGESKEAEEWYIKAYKAGFYRSLVDLALLIKSKKPDEAEGYLKDAVRRSVPSAEIYYADFLREQKRSQEALDYQEFHEDIVNEMADSSSDSSSGSDEELETPTFNEPVAPSTQEIQSVLESKAIQLIESQFVASSQYEKYVAPAVSKKQKKQWLRLSEQLKQAEERAKQERLSLQKTFSSTKTYKDVQVVMLPDAQSEIALHELKIQNLISMLANGEAKRGRLEFLTGHDNLYSMRLTRVDRLVFEVTGGNLEQGVTSIKIIAAKGHYDHLSARVKQTTAAIPVQWAEG